MPLRNLFPAIIPIYEQITSWKPTIQTTWKVSPTWNFEFLHLHTMDSTVTTDFCSHRAQFETTFLPIHFTCLSALLDYQSNHLFTTTSSFFLLLFLSQLLEQYFCYLKATSMLSRFSFTVLKVIVCVEKLFYCLDETTFQL